MNHAIDYFYEHAGHVLRSYMDVVPASKDDHCVICDRPNSEWADTASKVTFQSANSETHCLSCHSLFQGSEELFGVERRTRTGTPVPMKLGMATGCGALVTPGHTTLFLNGFIKKMSQAKAPPFEMVELSGLKAHQHLVANLPENDEFLYIGDFGRKKKDLVSNLRLSNAETLFICSENQCQEICLTMAEAFQEARGEYPDRGRKKLKRLLIDLYTGQIKPHDENLTRELEEIKAQYPATLRALGTMPDDPHVCLNTLKLW